MAVIASLDYNSFMAVLKLDKHDEAKEIAFEIEQLKKMSTKQLFIMMMEKSKIMKELLRTHGHPESPEIIKRK